MNAQQSLDTVARVESAYADVITQISRADTKAGMLLPLFGGSLAGVVALATRPMPLPAQVLLSLAAFAALSAVVLLLSVLRPRFADRDEHGFPFLARFADTPSRLLDALAERPGEQATAVYTVHLAVLARRKYTRVRTAVDLIVIALLLMATALTVAAVA